MLARYMMLQMQSLCVCVSVCVVQNSEMKNCLSFNSWAWISIELTTTYRKLNWNWNRSIYVLISDCEAFKLQTSRLFKLLNKSEFKVLVLSYEFLWMSLHFNSASTYWNSAWFLLPQFCGIARILFLRGPI